MTELQIAYLELAIVGGIGALLVIAGIVARALAKRANDSCTARTTGTVVKHRFAGEGRLYPVVQYEVSGKNYQVRKQYNGVKFVRVTGLPVPMQPEVREDEKGWLHVKLGPMANVRDLAEQLWPIGSGMTVHYLQYFRCALTHHHTSKEYFKILIHAADLRINLQIQ